MARQPKGCQGEQQQQNFKNPEARMERQQHHQQPQSHRNKI